MISRFAPGDQAMFYGKECTISSLLRDPASDDWTYQLYRVELRDGDETVAIDSELAAVT